MIKILAVTLTLIAIIGVVDSLKSAAREVVDIVAHFAFYILRHMTALFSFGVEI